MSSELLLRHPGPRFLLLLAGSRRGNGGWLEEGGRRAGGSATVDVGSRDGLAAICVRAGNVGEMGAIVLTFLLVALGSGIVGIPGERGRLRLVRLPVVGMVGTAANWGFGVVLLCVGTGAVVLVKVGFSGFGRL